MIHIRSINYDNSFLGVEYCNTYILFDDEKNAVIIDPGKKDNKVINFLINNELNPTAILLTHGHCDHIGGVETILNKYKNVKVYMHFDDFEYLSSPKLNLSNWIADEEFIVDVTPESIMDDEEPNFFKECPIKVIHTPYHTPGGVCYYLYLNGKIFTGDSLFYGGVGNTEFPGSNRKQMNQSLEKLFKLPEDTEVYPGHGGKTTIGKEKARNI